MPREGGRPDFVVTGRVLKPHGVLGWVKAEPLTTNPERFRAGRSFILEGEQEARLVLEGVEERAGCLLLKFRGLGTRREAEALSGRCLMVRPEELGEAPPGAYWEHQVVGLEVFTRAGRRLGEVAEVMETGANDVLVVEGEREFLIPMTEQVVVSIDLESGRIVVEPLPGLLED